MPNRVHVLLYFLQIPKALNTIIGKGKRFMAYEIIKRLTAADDKAMLAQLTAAVKEKEWTKGQLHKVFENSFDAKQCVSTDFICQKLDYIHHNPTSGNGCWQKISCIMNIKVLRFMKKVKVDTVTC